jgi:3-hydroxybutyryl-CoA dehydrogenase
MAIKSVLVVGAGLMGGGIAQVCAQAGIRVLLHDVRPEALQNAMGSIRWSVAKLIEKGKLEEPVEAVVQRITTFGELAATVEADLAIEAVFEDLNLKREVFRRLEAVLPDEALIASNTSAIPITELASASERPAKVFGLHFFSPVPMMRAVEVVKGAVTAEATAAAGRELVLQIGKEPIMVNRDVPGFVINRINFPSAIEAMKLVEQGVASVADIDKGLRLAAGRRMGIFETGDMVGLDVTYGALMAMYAETGDPRWYPPLLLRRKVKAGHLGRKAGRGWYAYDTEGKRIETDG